MLTETEFVVDITASDRVRVWFTLDQGQPQRVMVQLECEVNGRWLAARRYDNAHGSVHVHVTPWDAQRDRTIVVPGGDLRYEIERMAAELQVNWLSYRQRLVAELERWQDDT